MPGIATVRWNHDAIIDTILENPAISQNELSRLFGYSPSWMSIMINSDAFQERLAERKVELVDPKIRASLNERLDAIARVSLERLMDRLDNPNPGALKTMELIAIAKLGVGDKNTRPAGPVQSTNLYVVNLPPPAADSKSWLTQTQGNHPRGSLPIVEEVPRG